MLNLSVRAARERLRGWFPDREFLMRSEGQVRFIRLSSRLQMAAAGVVCAAALGWAGTLGGVAISQWRAGADQQSLVNREARVESAEHNLSTYRKGLDGVTDDLKRRQDFIEKMVQAHLGDLPRDQQADAGPAQGNGKAARKVSAALPEESVPEAPVPEAGRLARLETRQLAFVERLTIYAERRAAADADAMRKLGLNPRLMLASLDRGEAEGGPFIRLSTSTDGSLDPRFQRLGASLARMSALEAGLARLPQVLPARMDYISSGFGYRSDPFTHAGSFHPGLDFRGPMGAPIFAAARGRVSFAGQRSGYGNCVEITHGPGLVTRYAHMSAFRAHVGEQVDAGQVIGAIGSTGRSTGPHLHFEVRIDDRPVNPRPFLAHVFAENRFHVPEKNGASALVGATDD